jgi:serine protease AprX
VINNSWYCPPDEGCTNWDSLQAVVNNTRAAGIVVVVSAGNTGRYGCGSVDYPPAIYDSSFSVGATDEHDNIADFSSRGPADHTNLLKPDISAPGQGIISSVPGGGYDEKSGTSMAAPHVSGLVALLLSARPYLTGQVEAIETQIEQNALPLTTLENCGGVPGSQIPNYTFGWGRIDALETISFFTYFPLIMKSP